MIDKSNGPFRKCLAKFIRKQRRYHTNKEVKEMIFSFCAGWTALSDELDKIFEKHVYESKKPL